MIDLVIALRLRVAVPSSLASLRIDRNPNLLAITFKHPVIHITFKHPVIRITFNSQSSASHSIHSHPHRIQTSSHPHLIQFTVIHIPFTSQSSPHHIQTSSHPHHIQFTVIHITIQEGSSHRDCSLATFSNSPRCLLISIGSVASFTPQR
jgi:hypothetical protein